MLHCNRQNNTLAEETASKQLKSQCHCSSDTTTANMSSECCDVIVAHSPPLFTAHNSPAELSVLYKNWLVISHKQQSPLPVRRLNAARSSNSPTREQDKQQDKQQLDKQTAAVLQVKTRRPCLVIRADSDCSIGSLSSGSSSDENEPSSPTRRKKKVVFADDRGLSLTQVRLMNEPSNQPPKLMTVGSYLQNPAAPQSALPGGGAGLGMAAAKPAGADQAQWRLRFPQPASNYLDFRKRLDVDNVSLENVIVKSADQWILGTVKVRNMSYDKDVFVRCTRDKWTTHEDTECAYVQNNTMVNGSGGGGGAGSGQNGSSGGCGGPANIYDTFSFRLPLPADAAFMEFAVCYKSPDFEHWDNNDGRNYGLSVEQPAGGPLKPLSPSSSSAQLLLPPQASQPLSVAAPYDCNKQQQLPPVHYFGALSNKQSWWNTPRDQKKDSSSAYW